MTGLRSWSRDAGLPARAGDHALVAPSPGEVERLVREHLLRPGAPDPSDVCWSYARWKPRVSLACAYRLDFPDGSSRHVHLKRHLDGKSAELAARLPGGADVPEGAEDAWLRPAAAVPAEGLVLFALPWDRELPGLVRLYDSRRLVRWLREEGLFGDRTPRAHRSRLELLRHRPGKRAVARLDLGLKAPDGARSGARLAARALVPEDAVRTLAARRAVGPIPHAPRLLAAQARTGLLLEEWLDVDALRPDDFAAAQAAGHALARLHRLPAPEAALDVPRASGVPRGADPDLLDWHADLRALRRGVPAHDAGGPPVWSHGDFHPDQLARRRAGGPVPGETCLLDLDALRAAPAALDLASWIADALAADDSIPAPGAAPVTRREAAEAFERAAGPLLAGYGEGGGHAPARGDLLAATADELSRRAASALRRLQQDAVAVAARLLRLATAVGELPTGGPGAP